MTQESSELIARFLAILKNLKPDRKQLIARIFAISLNMRPERSAVIARFWPIPTEFEYINYRAQLLAAKVYTVIEIITIRYFKLRTRIEQKILYL